jgi:hypothetical protein
MSVKNLKWNFPIPVSKIIDFLGTIHRHVFLFKTQFGDWILSPSTGLTSLFHLGAGGWALYPSSDESLFKLGLKTETESALLYFR